MAQNPNVLGGQLAQLTGFLPLFCSYVNLQGSAALPDPIPEKFTSRINSTISQILEIYDSLIQDATLPYGDVKGWNRLLDEIKADAIHNERDITQKSEQWIEQVRHELQHSHHFRQQDAVAVLHYFRQEYLEEVEHAADPNYELTDDEANTLAEAVHGQLVGHLWFTLHSISRARLLFLTLFRP